MSRFSRFSEKETVSYRHFETEQVVNFMDGISYKVNPLSTLKLVAGSSIFGEPSYYRASHDAQKYLENLFPWDLKIELADTATTTDIFNLTVDEALAYDFIGTLELAIELRQKFFMRLNPSLILVRSVMHKNRAEFSKKSGNFLRR